MTWLNSCSYQNYTLLSPPSSFISVFAKFKLFSLKAITCDPLPEVSGGTYNPASCDDNATKFDLSCTLDCPDGYYISYGSTVKSVRSDTRVCYVNGSWTYQPGSPACVGKNSLMISMFTHFEFGIIPHSFYLSKVSRKFGRLLEMRKCKACIVEL